MVVLHASLAAGHPGRRDGGGGPGPRAATTCSAVDDVARACDAALQRATADDAVLVTGSLYVVGAARPHLQRVLP